MSNLNLQVTLSAMDKLTAPFRNASAQAEKLSQALKGAKSAVKDLENTQNKMDSWKRTSESILEAKESLQKYHKKLAELKGKHNLAKQDVASTRQELREAKRNYTHASKNAIKNPTPVNQTKMLQASSAVHRLEVSLDKLREKSAKLGKEVYKQEKDTNALHKAQIKRKKELHQISQALNKAGIDTKKYADHQTELTAKTEVATKALEAKKRALEKTNAIAQYKQDYRNRVDNLKANSERMQNMGQRAMLAGATVTAPVANSVRDYMSFETAMAGVARQVSGLKDENNQLTAEYGEWENKIRDLSKELPLTTVQIADMVTAGARMDIPKEELEEFVRLSSQMAVAFDAANPAELTEKFGKVSKNFNLSTQGSRELADAINYLDDNAIAKGDNLIGFLNRVSGIAGTAKMSAKEVVALGSTLQTLGAGEEDSATAVNAMLTRLAVAGNHKEVDGALGTLGLNPKKIAEAMTVDAGKTLMRVVEKIKSLPDAEKTFAMKQLSGLEHIKTLSLLVKKTDEWKRQIDLVNSTEAQGSMAKEFETQMNTLANKWIVFKNQLFNANSSIGASLKTSLAGIMKSLGKVLDKIQNWINKNPELTATIVKWVAAIGASLTVFGALSMAMSFLFYPIVRLALGFGHLTSAGSLLSSVLKMGGGSFSLLSSSAFKYQTTLSVLGKIKTILIQKMYTFIGLIKSVPTLIKSLPALFSSVFGSLLSGIASFSGGLLSAFYALPSAFMLLLAKMKTLSFWVAGLKLLFAPLLSLFGLLISPIGLIVTALVGGAALIYAHWEKVKAFFSGFIEGLKLGFAAMAPAFQPVIDLFSWFVDLLKSVWDWFTALFTPVETTRTALESAAAAGQWFGNALASAINFVLTPLQWLIAGLDTVIGKMTTINGLNNLQKANQTALDITNSAAVNALTKQTKTQAKATKLTSNSIINSALSNSNAFATPIIKQTNAAAKSAVGDSQKALDKLNVPKPNKDVEQLLKEAEGYKPADDKKGKKGKKAGGGGSGKGRKPKAPKVPKAAKAAGDKAKKVKEIKDEKSNEIISRTVEKARGAVTTQAQFDELFRSPSFAPPKMAESNGVFSGVLGKVVDVAGKLFRLPTTIINGAAKLFGSQTVPLDTKRIKFDNRPPILSPAAKTNSGATNKANNAPPVINQNITIEIKTQPGQSEQSIAQQIKKALQDMQREAQAKARSSLWDRY